MVEEVSILTERIEKQKDLQKSQIIFPKESNLINAIAKIDHYVYFYFLDKFFASPFLDSFVFKLDQECQLQMKDFLAKEYIELHNIYNQFVVNFINKNLIDQIYFLRERQYNEENARQIAWLQFQNIFQCCAGPERSITQIVLMQVDYYDGISNDKFRDEFLNSDIAPSLHSKFIEFKNDFVEIYKDYFEKAKNRLPALRDLNDYGSARESLTNFITKHQQEKQERYIFELMRFYALYPEDQPEALRVIIEMCKSKRIEVGEPRLKKQNDRFEVVNTDTSKMTEHIQLSRLAKLLEKEGLLPDYIQFLLLLTHSKAENISAKIKPPADLLEDRDNRKGKEKKLIDKREEGNLDQPENSISTKSISAQSNTAEIIVAQPTDLQLHSFASTVQLFSNADLIMQSFKDCSSNRQYEDVREKHSAVSKVNGILRNAKTVIDYNTAFNLMAPYINRHKNFLTNFLFNNKNTDTWKKVMKQIREPAIAALMGEVNGIDGVDAKIKRLKEACEMPLFNQHRNNHWYTGAFGDTHAVSLIKKEIANLEEQKKQPRLSL